LQTPIPSNKDAGDNDSKCETPENGHKKFKVKPESNTNSDDINDDERTPMNMENGGAGTPNNETAFNNEFENGNIDFCTLLFKLI
jgi:hypothetical protein